MARVRSFRCELEESNETDENGNRLTTIKCHGELITETADKLKEVVSPLIPLRGHIVIDLGDVRHLDSSGPGALISLKASSVRQGLCILQLVNMTSGIRELLRITNLTQ